MNSFASPPPVAAGRCGARVPAEGFIGHQALNGHGRPEGKSPLMAIRRNAPDQKRGKAPAKPPSSAPVFCIWMLDACPEGFCLQHLICRNVITIDSQSFEKVANNGQLKVLRKLT